MRDSISTHNFAQMQHAEYEAQAASYHRSTNASQENLGGHILGRIAMLIQRTSEKFSQQPTKAIRSEYQQA